MAGGKRCMTVSLLAAVFVAGCGGGGATPLEVAQSKAQALNAMTDEIVGDGTLANPGLSHTSIANMPTSGSATFKGYAGVLIGRSFNPQPNAVLVGDASVTADFDKSTLTGYATGFYGASIDPVTGNQLEAVRAIGGTLNLTNGCIGAAACGGAISNPYEAAGQVDGNLSGGGHVISLSAPVTGEIYGNPAPKGVALGGSGTGQMDGASYDKVIVSLVGKTP